MDSHRVLGHIREDAVTRDSDGGAVRLAPQTPWDTPEAEALANLLHAEFLRTGRPLTLVVTPAATARPSVAFLLAFLRGVRVTNSVSRVILVAERVPAKHIQRFVRAVSGALGPPMEVVSSNESPFIP